MAKGIQDLGIGLGYLYKTLPDGVTIVAVEKNTKEGVRSMKTQGTTNGPVIADRPAVGTITVTSVASVGAITAITIGGVNQIGANINVVSSTASVVAAQIASAINRYSPVGTDDFTAQAIGDVVMVFSPANTGSTSNGLTITVTATDPSIVTTTTPLNNGSSQNSVYDTTFGYRFYIDADYGSAGTPGGGTATPSSLTYAAEITQYMTLRGLQSGIFTTSATIASDSITSLTRCSAITQVLVSNQGGAATDVLAFIQTEGFAVGDEIQLASAAPGTQVPTLESAPTTTSSVGTPNLYLTNDTSFVMDSYTSITLQLRDVPSVGLAWVETGRAIADGVITVTKVQLSTAAGSALLKPKGLYYITDIGDYGTYVFAVSSTQIEGVGAMIRAVPYGYSTTWRSDMSAPAVGTKVRYYQNVYNSVTGAVGTAPDTDTTNWLLIAKSNTTYYQQQAHAVGLNSAVNLGWPIIWEKDYHNNTVSQSELCSSVMGINAFEVFAWQQRSATTVYGNTVTDAVFDCANSAGSVYQNMVAQGAKFDSNRLPSSSIVAGNTFTGDGTRVYSNYVTNIIGNTVKNGGQIYSNGAAGAYFYQIGVNTVEGNITALTSVSAGNKSVEYCTVERGAEIKNSTFATAAQIRYTTVRSGSVITGCVFGIPTSTSNIEACEVRGISTLTINGTGRMTNCIVHDSAITLTISTFPITAVNFFSSTVTATLDAASANSEIKSSTLTLTGSFNNSYITGMSTTGTPTITFAGAVVSPLGSNIQATIDLDDAGVFSAGVLTISTNDQFAGTFIMNSTAVRNISQIVNLPTPFEVAFIPAASFNFTFTCTGKATIAGDQIAGTAASFVATLNAVTSANDTVWVAKPFTFNTITRTTILA